MRRQSKNPFRAVLIGLTTFALAIGFVAIAAAAPCEVTPEPNGDIILPPAGCSYQGNIDTIHAVLATAKPDTKIIIDANHWEFLCQAGHLKYCTRKGGPLGQIEEFESALTLNVTVVSPSGSTSGSVTIPTQVKVASGPLNAISGPFNTPTEMLQIMGSGSDGFFFDSLTITAGSDFGYPSPGQVSIGPISPNGTVSLQSSFDIGFRMEFTGAPGGPLDGLDGCVETNAVVEAGGPDSTANSC